MNRPHLYTSTNYEYTYPVYSQIEKTERGAHVRLLLAEKHEEDVLDLTPTSSAVEISFYSSQPYSELGHSMAPMPGGGLAIGAPGYVVQEGSHLQGCVFIVRDVLSFSGPASVESASDQIICEQEAEEESYSRFGQSLALSDVDGDGEADLLVGASSSGSATFSYVGRVLVFPGLGGGAFSASASLTVLPDSGGDDDYSTFGWAMATAEADAVVVSARHFLGSGVDQAGRRNWEMAMRKVYLLVGKECFSPQKNAENLGKSAIYCTYLPLGKRVLQAQRTYSTQCTTFCDRAQRKDT